MESLPLLTSGRPPVAGSWPAATVRRALLSLDSSSTRNEGSGQEERAIAGPEEGDGSQKAVDEVGVRASGLGHYPLGS